MVELILGEVVGKEEHHLRLSTSLLNAIEDRAFPAGELILGSGEVGFDEVGVQIHPGVDPILFTVGVAIGGHTDDRRLAVDGDQRRTAGVALTAVQRPLVVEGVLPDLCDLNDHGALLSDPVFGEAKADEEGLLSLPVLAHRAHQPGEGVGEGGGLQGDDADVVHERVAVVVGVHVQA